jgi:hypothetical protein
MNLSIHPSHIEPLKSELRVLAPHVKASHRIEAMARGFGFGSHAALLSAIADGTVSCSLDDRAFATFLRERGGKDLPYDTLSEAVVRVRLPEQRAAIEAVMAREPGICANGYRTHDPRRSPQDNVAAFNASRHDLLRSAFVKQFVRAIEYLHTQEKSNTVSRKRTSYGYKHAAEDFHRAAASHADPYVANGVLIAAAIHLGFTVKRDGASPNAFINIAAPKVPRRRSDLAGSLRGPKKLAAWRNLMVAAINAGLEQGIFGLAENDNRWKTTYGIYRFDFDELPAIACVCDAGFGELSVHVALNPTRRAEEFIVSSNAGFIAGDAFASGWLERKLGAWLQTSTSATGSVRTALLERIVAANPAPQGFSDNGRVMM